MKTIVINGNEYKIKYGFNSFADTDLLDRVQKVTTVFSANNGESDDELAMAKVKDLFVIVRELLFVGFEKYNPVESIVEVGDLLDDYRDEATEDEDRSLFAIFSMLLEELTDEGFLADLMAQTQKNVKSIPTDHKKSVKKSPSAK